MTNCTVHTITIDLWTRLSSFGSNMISRRLHSLIIDSCFRKHFRYNSIIPNIIMCSRAMYPFQWISVIFAYLPFWTFYSSSNGVIILLRRTFRRFALQISKRGRFLAQINTQGIFVINRFNACAFRHCFRLSRRWICNRFIHKRINTNHTEIKCKIWWKGGG